MIDCNIIQFPRGRDRYGLIRYPHLGVRFGPAAGERVPVSISKGPYCFTLDKGDTRLCHPNPFNSDGSVTEALRADFLWEAVQFVRQSWRPTIYWSEQVSSTIWANAIHHRVGSEEVEVPVEVCRLTRDDVNHLMGALRMRGKT
jgi:hypothetical protein